VNDHTAFRTDWMPFAGRRQSGYGIGGIPWSMHEMTQEKMDSLRRDLMKGPSEMVSHGNDCFGSTKLGFKATVFCSERAFAISKALGAKS
jgi:hypothetical protein